LSRTQYFYPFEVVKYRGEAFKKSFILGLLSEATCCACNENLKKCHCPSNEQEQEQVSKVAIRVFEMRRKFWEEYDGDYKDNDAIVQYAEEVAKYHKSLLGNEA